MKKLTFGDSLTGFPPKEYPILRALRIGQGDDTLRLYALESRVADAMTKAAKEIEKIVEKNHLGWPEESHYTHAVPQSLIAALDAFDRTSGEVAAISFLLSRGYEVSKPDKEEP